MKQPGLSGSVKILVPTGSLGAGAREDELAYGIAQGARAIATDAGSQRDFRAFARLAGHVLEHEEELGGVYRYWLRKA